LWLAVEQGIGCVVDADITVKPSGTTCLNEKFIRRDALRARTLRTIAPACRQITREQRGDQACEASVPPPAGERRSS